LKNQFRSLDDDEVDFLDSILETQRAKERALKEETDAQLAAFRKQREKAERETVQTSPTADDIPTEWMLSGKKRKAASEKGIVKGLKLRKTSSSESKLESIPDVSSIRELKEEQKPSRPIAPKTESKPASSAAPSLGLVAYSSDEDSE